MNHRETFRKFRLIPALGDSGLGGRAGHAQFGHRDWLENDLLHGLLFCAWMGRILATMIANIDWILSPPGTVLTVVTHLILTVSSYADPVVSSSFQRRKWKHRKSVRGHTGSTWPSQE